MNNMTFYGKSLLFMGAHPDDIELGCGALIADLVGEADIFCMTFSDNQKNPDLLHLIGEHRNSMHRLGLQDHQFALGTYETRRFPDFRQEILQEMLELRKKYQPEIVFVHTVNDMHQDHNTLTEEATRAFRGTTVLGFDVLRSSHGFFPNFLAEVSEEALETKIAALAEYSTYRNRYYFAPDITRATATRHGALAERPYAEGFDIIRIVANFAKTS